MSRRAEDLRSSLVRQGRPDAGGRAQDLRSYLVRSPGSGGRPPGGVSGGQATGRLQGRREVARGQSSRPRLTGGDRDQAAQGRRTQALVAPKTSPRTPGCAASRASSRRAGVGRLPSQAALRGPTEDAAARSKAERPSDISGHHQRHEAERASSRNLVLLPQRAQPTHLPGAKPKHWRVRGVANAVRGEGRGRPSQTDRQTRCLSAWRTAGDDFLYSAGRMTPHRPAVARSTRSDRRRRRRAAT